jgi:recombination protein RecA
LYIGGLPKGKICEVLGLPTSGKTTLALKFLAQAQAGGGQVAYVDQARYFDPDYAYRCGINLSRLWVGAPYSQVEALATMEALVRDGSLVALVFDLMDYAWDEPSFVSCLNRLTAPLSRSGTSLLFLHTSTHSLEGSHSTVLAHYAAVRLQVTHEGWLRRHGDVRGYEARVLVLKNRLGPAGREARITIEFNGTVRGNGL